MSFDYILNVLTYILYYIVRKKGPKTAVLSRNANRQSCIYPITFIYHLSYQKNKRFFALEDKDFLQRKTGNLYTHCV